MKVEDLEKLPIGKRNKRLQKKLKVGAYTQYQVSSDYEFEEPLTSRGLDELLEVLYDYADHYKCFLFVDSTRTRMYVSFHNKAKLENLLAFYNNFYQIVELWGGSVDSSIVEPLIHE